MIAAPVDVYEQRAIATVLADMDAEIAALEAKLWGDLAHHDEHHAHGLLKVYRREARKGNQLPRWASPRIAWMNMAYARRLYERYKRPDEPDLNGFWNSRDPMSATFAMLSSLDPERVGQPADRDGLGARMLGM